MGELAESTWQEIATRPRTVVAVPIGSTEQHGPHLPAGTDTVIAVALARALASARTDVVVAPAIGISASGEHAGFPGTLSIGTDALRLVLVELVRSADWADGVVFVNGHGGNGAALASAIATLHSEGRNVLAWWPTAPDDPRSDAHAGWLETSVMLHLMPALVQSGLAAAGDARPMSELLPMLRSVGVKGVSTNGVLGNPTGATADEGERILNAWATDLVMRFDAWFP